MQSCLNLDCSAFCKCTYQRQRAARKATTSNACPFSFNRIQQQVRGSVVIVLTPLAPTVVDARPGCAVLYASFIAFAVSEPPKGFQSRTSCGACLSYLPCFRELTPTVLVSNYSSLIILTPKSPAKLSFCSQDGGPLYLLSKRVVSDQREEGQPW